MPSEISITVHAGPVGVWPEHGGAMSGAQVYRATGNPVDGHTGRATLAPAFRSRKATGTAARINAPVRANAAG